MCLHRDPQRTEKLEWYVFSISRKKGSEVTCHERPTNRTVQVRIKNQMMNRNPKENGAKSRCCHSPALSCVPPGAKAKRSSYGIFHCRVFDLKWHNIWSTSVLVSEWRLGLYSSRDIHLLPQRRCWVSFLWVIQILAPGCPGSQWLKDRHRRGSFLKLNRKGKALIRPHGTQVHGLTSKSFPLL